MDLQDSTVALEDPSVWVAVLDADSAVAVVGVVVALGMAGK